MTEVVRPAIVGVTLVTTKRKSPLDLVRDLVAKVCSTKSKDLAVSMLNTSEVVEIFSTDKFTCEVYEVEESHLDKYCKIEFCTYWGLVSDTTTNEMVFVAYRHSDVDGAIECAKNAIAVMLGEADD